MYISNKFLIIGALMVGASALNGYVTHNSIITLEKQAEAARELGALQLKQMEIDMMHDAINGDSILLKDLATAHNKPEYTENLTSLREHIKKAEENFDSIKAYDLPEAFLTKTAEVKEQFQGYARSAEKIANADTAEAAEHAFSEESKQFKVLENVLEGYIDEEGEALVKSLREEQKVIIESTMTKSKILSLINILLSISVPIYVIRGILKPQKQMIVGMQTIAQGTLTHEVPYQQRKDEVGEMSRSLEVFKQNALEKIRLETVQKQRDLEAEEMKKMAMNDLANNFETNVKGVVDMVASAATEMEATSRSVGQIVDTSKAKMTSLTQQIEGTSRSVQSVASATSQLSSAVNEINQQITRSTSITNSAVDEAKKADITVQTLTEAANKIGEVVEMINTIAAQINLLALNATIEAARAGDAGKGFAVVASEVKNLATQTTKATEQIAQFISSIQGATGETVSAINSIGGKIREINEISTTIAAAVEEQSVATQDIANNVKQAADSTNTVLTHASEVSRASSETGESATQMIAATDELSRQSEMLRTEVDKFLSGVRS